jgi:hypothetical protein
MSGPGVTITSAVSDTITSSWSSTVAMMASPTNGRNVSASFFRSRRPARIQA